MGNFLAPTWTDSPAAEVCNQKSAPSIASSSNTTDSPLSSLCSASTLSPPAKESNTPVLIRRPSNVFRPLGVSEMEIKSYCTKIKLIVGGSKLSVSDNLNFLDVKLSSKDENMVLNCFENIIMIVERPDALPLEPLALKDLNIAVKSLQTNQPTLASQYTDIIAKARNLIEAKTMTSMSPASIVQVPLSGRTTPQGLDASLSLKIHGGDEAPISPQMKKISSSGRLFDETTNATRTSPSMMTKKDPLAGSSHGLLSSTIEDDELCFLDLATATEMPLGVPVL